MEERIKEWQAWKAAELLREYCNQKPLDCYGCVFKDPGRGCALGQLEDVPVVWELPGENKQEQTRRLK